MFFFGFQFFYYYAKLVLTYLLCVRLALDAGISKWTESSGLTA